jgi:hypothetical protein
MLMLSGKKQAMVEFEDLASAAASVTRVCAAPIRMQDLRFPLLSVLHGRMLLLASRRCRWLATGLV